MELKILFKCFFVFAVFINDPMSVLVSVSAIHTGGMMLQGRAPSAASWTGKDISAPSAPSRGENQKRCLAARKLIFEPAL